MPKNQEVFKGRQWAKGEMEDWDGFGLLQQKESAEMILSVLIASCVQGAAVPAQKMKWMTEENSGEQSETSDDYVTKEGVSSSGYEKRNGRKGGKWHRRSLYNLQRMIIVFLHCVRNLKLILQNVHQRGAKYRMPQKR